MDKDYGSLAEEMEKIRELILVLSRASAKVDREMRRIWKDYASLGDYVGQYIRQTESILKMARERGLKRDEFERLMMDLSKRTKAEIDALTDLSLKFKLYEYADMPYVFSHLEDSV